MDFIRIEGLRCRCRVGVPAAERRRRQPILIDLGVGLDLKQAGREDQVKATIDYAAVADAVKKMVEGRPFRLVEAMAEAVARFILTRFGPDQVQVRVRKFSVPGAESVGVEITRGRLQKK